MERDSRPWTPGPWKIAGAVHVYGGGERPGNICSISEPRSTKEVKYTPLELGSPDSEEAYANAHLIAAAPDLYEALASIHRELVRQDIKFGPLIADAEAALAKAVSP